MTTPCTINIADDVASNLELRGIYLDSEDIYAIAEAVKNNLDEIGYTDLLMRLTAEYLRKKLSDN
jgi:hypothetical protein